MKKIVFFLFVISLTLVSAKIYAADTWTSGGTTITLSGSGTNKTLTVTKTGNGQMADYTSGGTNTLWGTEVNNVKTLIISQDVTHIGAYAFQGFSTLTTVTIPASVTSIGVKAFTGCSHTNRINASTPNDWASIDFGDAWSNPFGQTAASGVTDRQFYFNGKNTATSVLVFKAGIETIHQYAFYHATGINEIHLPGTVNEIGTYAFYCNIAAPSSSTAGSVTINRLTPPITGEKAFSFKNTETGSSKYTRIYVPEGSTGYNTTPWYGGTGSSNKVENASGALYIGRSGDSDKCSAQGYNISGTGYVYPVSGHVNQGGGAYLYDWELDEDGVLTITGDGMIYLYSSSYTSTATEVLPWYRFRHLVNKVILRNADGTTGFTAFGGALTQCDGLIEIILEQPYVPSYPNLPSSFLHTSKLTIKVPTAAICVNGPNQLNNVSYRTLNQIVSNQPVVISDGTDNSTLLLKLHQCSYLTPFQMQLGRSLSNAYYNTFCSPIPMDEATITSKFGTGTAIYELDNTEYDDVANELTLNFAARTAIEAGHPYLIKPGEATANPTFDNVNPDNVVSTADNGVPVYEKDAPSTSYITAHGILAPYTPTDAEYGKTFLFLKANNVLTWASAGTLNGMRAFFKVNDGAPEGLKKAAAIMRMPNVATGVDEVYVTPGENTTLSTNVEKVMRDGQLLIIRDGKTYNAQGQLIQ